MNQKLVYFVLLVLTLTTLGSAQAKNPPSSAPVAGNASAEAFHQALAELQQKPEDDDLRKRVVELGSQVKPTPEIPKDARSLFSKAYMTVAYAKSPKDYESAISGYQKALAIAPWWAAAYYHLGAAYEHTGNVEQAIRNYQFFLSSNPGHAGAREALDRIRLLSAKSKKENGPDQK